MRWVLLAVSVLAASALLVRVFMRPAPVEQAAKTGEEKLVNQALRGVESKPDLTVQEQPRPAAESPASTPPDERSFQKMRELVNLGQIAGARDEAAAFFERFPQSPWAAKVTQLTGVHPRPPTGPRR